MYLREHKEEIFSARGGLNFSAVWGHHLPRGDELWEDKTGSASW